MYTATRELPDGARQQAGTLSITSEQRTEDGIGIQSHFRHHFRHSQRVDDIGGTVFSFLVDMFVPGIFHRFVDQCHIGIGHTLQNGGTHGIVMGFEGFQK